MKANIEAKKQELAKCFAGEVIDDQPGLAVYIKGKVQGLAATLQAFYPGWPFGVQYIIETEPNGLLAPDSNSGGRISLYPRVGRGLASFLTYLFLFEGKSMPVGDKDLEGQFNFVYDNREIAEEFVQLEGVADQLRELESQCHFSELIIRTDVGIYLAQPTSFNSLTESVCQQTFSLLAALAKEMKKNF
jgi:hypothetical protein